MIEEVREIFLLLFAFDLFVNEDDVSSTHLHLTPEHCSFTLLCVRLSWP
jgi:hypothetical protein